MINALFIYFAYNCTMAHFPRTRITTSARHGFSLIELSVVVAIMAIVAVAGLEGAASFLTRSAYGTTQEKLATLDAALVQFFRANGRLPCPALHTTAPTTSTYGFEDCTITVLTGTSTLPGGGVVAGAIPFRALNLPMDASIDAYGSKLFYYVTKNLTTAGVATGQFGFKPTITSATIASAVGSSGLVQISLPGAGLSNVSTGSNVLIYGASAGNGSYTVTRNSDTSYVLQGSVFTTDTFTGGTFQPTTMIAADAATAGIGGIEIRTGTQQVTCTTTCQIIALPTTDYTTSTGAAYAIASAGADRRGAVNKFGTLQKDCAATASDNDKIDEQNCRAFDTPATTSSFSATPLNVLYDSRFNTGTQEANYFDDLIVWRTRQQL